MCLIAKSGGFRSHGNEDINSYVNSYTNTSEKAEPTASTRFIKRFSKPGIPTYNSEVADTAGRKRITTTTKTQTIAMRYAFHVNAIKYSDSLYDFKLLVNGNPVFVPVDYVKALSLTLHLKKQFGDNFLRNIKYGLVLL